MKTQQQQWHKGEFKIATNPNCKTIEEQPDTRKGYVLKTSQTAV